MTTKDLSLLSEAYISATQKAVNVLPSIPQPDTDQEVLPVVLTPTNEPNYPGEEESFGNEECECGGTEESEETFMTKSNLFSIFCHAKKLHQLCESGVVMDPWMHQKIAVCVDSLESVFRSANYEASRQEVSCD
jgi:hypothetical protein